MAKILVLDINFLSLITAIILILDIKMRLISTFSPNKLTNF